MLGRDSHGKRLGVKLPHGAFAKAGAIIVRQRGSKVFPGVNVMRGGDDTLFATVAGLVRFVRRVRPSFSGKRREVNIVSIEPLKADAKS